MLDEPNGFANGFQGERTMIFKAWLIQQRKRADPVGDLARDVIKDRTWPPTQDMVKLREHLKQRVAAESILSALDQAYAEYQKQGNKQRPSGIG